MTGLIGRKGLLEKGSLVDRGFFFFFLERERKREDS